jgi:penicillin amidase
MLRRALQMAATFIAVLAVAAGVYAANVAIGYNAKARVDGTMSHLKLTAPVQIIRDDRGVPHIRAQNERDLFFAEGYVQGQDRLFQLDLIRRFVYGELSEILGPSLLVVDERSRIVPVRRIVGEQWRGLNAHQQMMLTAFADGVNAAAARESTPVEFRALDYRMQRWEPQDALAAGFATVLDLTDNWNDIEHRNARAPLSDPCFDAPVTMGLRGIADPRCATGRHSLSEMLRVFGDTRPPMGSNEWASGAGHTGTGRALLANDPHLALQIPGVWYLVDLQAPGYHAAGATLAGTPGVILGHNDWIAWGATNGTVASMSIFTGTANHAGMQPVTETFHVRFGGTVTRTYYRNAQEFEAPRVVVRWPAYAHPVSPLPTFDGLDRAASIEDALRTLRRYPGPTQNFVIADATGRAAYQLAGVIPEDPLWARAAHPARDLAKRYPAVPFDELPHVAPARGAIVWTSNNKMYGPHYPLRLSAAFTPPCRAFRVATLLRDRARYDVAYFTRMQMDVNSPCEQQLASFVPELSRWNGDVSGNSVLATQAIRLRIAFVRISGSMMRALESDANQSGRLRDLFSEERAPALPWSQAGRVTVQHSLSALGFWFLNGTTLPGNGDAYTVHVQTEGFSQSFRAVWDIGNWDAGGISLPQGESGRPGSGHYTDEAADWVAGKLLSLPYSAAAVDRAAVDRLTLSP